MEHETPDHPSVAAAWAGFEKDMLNSLGSVSEEQREMARKQFYAGMRSTLQLLQVQLRHAENPEAAKQILKTLSATDDAMDPAD